MLTLGEAVVIAKAFDMELSDLSKALLEEVNKMEVMKNDKASGQVRPDFTPVVVGMAVFAGIFITIQKYFFRSY